MKQTSEAQYLAKLSQDTEYKQESRLFDLKVSQFANQIDLDYWFNETHEYGILENNNLYGSVWYSDNEPDEYTKAAFERFDFWFESDLNCAGVGWFLCRDLFPNNVSRLPKQVNGYDLEFKLDSQDVEKIKADYPQTDYDDYDSFFIVDKPDCTIIWGMWGIVPYLARSVDRLV